jgi:DNA-binding Xre family transcriptional regulator
MAMKLRIKETAERLGIMNAKQLRDYTGLGMGTCYQLWDGSARGIQFDTLNTLCNSLQVGPAMLFEYTPDVEPQAGASSPAQGDNPKQARRSHSGSAKTKRESKQARAAVVTG